MNFCITCTTVLEKETFSFSSFKEKTEFFLKHCFFLFKCLTYTCTDMGPMHPFLRIRLKLNLKKGPKKNKVTKNCKEHFFFYNRPGSEFWKIRRNSGKELRNSWKSPWWLMCACYLHLHRYVSPVLRYDGPLVREITLI